MSEPPVFIPTTNPDDHGVKLVLCGALLISPVVMMSAISIYNRVQAKTLLQVDNLLTLLGTVLTLATYATFVHAKNLGFGKHTRALDDSRLQEIKNTILTAILMFFISQASTTLAYNIMAKKTARSQKFTRNIDAFSGAIAIWALANVVIIAVSLAKRLSPPYIFFVLSAVVAMCIVAMQLAAFMWIVWSTSAHITVKIRWSVSLGLFVPILTTSIIMRLVVLPRDLFANDWTFTLIPTTLLFLIELFLLVMNLLAPSLPVFFDQTSTGGLYFRPDDNPRATTYSSLAQRSRTGASKNNTRGKDTMDDDMRDDDHFVELTKMNNAFSASARREQEQRGRTSFDSDAILVRRSVEVS